MSMRILSERDVYELLSMKECMRVMAETLKATGRGGAASPLRTMLRLPDRSGLLGMMPAYLDSPRCTGIKVVTVMPGNHGTEFDAHQGAVLYFEAEHGCLRAVIDATSVTAIRTAAVSGVATQLLARKDAESLAILGSGVQARTHLGAMLEARSITRIRVWSRSSANAARFAQREADRYGVAIEASDSAREAVEGADIICTTTSAAAPVLAGDWVRPGAHLNAVGACVPKARELDTPAVVRSRLFVDRLESALNEAGDILIPIEEGTIGEDHILGEIGELLLGEKQGRLAADDITLFKSLGIGVEDLGTAEYLHRRAVETDAGIAVEFGGLRDGVGSSP
jgi:ornithine cyclodeaminase